MKPLLILLLLAGCTEIQVQTTDPNTGAAETVTVKTVRRIAISSAKVTVISGQVLIDDSTVQVLAKEAIPALSPIKK